MRRYWIAWLVLCFFLLVWFVQTDEKTTYWGDAVKLATVESLVERGTWQIDDSAFRQETGDVVFLGGHYYSVKLPLPEAIEAAIYALLRALFGAQIGDGCEPGEVCVYKWLTFLVVGVPSAVMLAVFSGAVARQHGSVYRSLLVTFLLAFATMIWPYSLTLNNHIPAAACLFVAFILVLESRLLFLAGLLCGLAISFDLLAGFVGMSLLAVTVLRCRRKAWLFPLGSLLPIAATMLFNYQIWGSVLPAYFAVEGFDYPGSTWDTVLAAHHPPGNVLDYAFKYLVGERGFFSHSPILLWGVAGMIIAMRNRRYAFRQESVLLSIGMLTPLGYLLTRTNHYGGWAYGERFLIVLVPFLVYYLPWALPSLATARLPHLRGLDWRRAGQLVLQLCLVAVFIVAICLSILSAWQGVNHTWRESHPLVYPYTQQGMPFLGLRIRVAAKDLEKLTSLEGLRRFGDCPKWDIEGATILDELPSTAHPVMANFEDRIMLLGYDLPSRRVKAGESFPITVYWESLSLDNDFYRESNQLLDSRLKRMGGFDRPPLLSNTGCWDPGDVLVDQYPVPVSPDAPDGVYQLLIGLYRGQDEDARFLHLVDQGVRTGTANVTIGPIKVGGPPPGSTVSEYQPERSMGVSLGDIIELVGYDSGMVDGSTLFLRLYWRSLAETDADYSVFVHALNEDGKMVSQADHLSAQRADRLYAYPTSLWDEGEVIIDEVLLQIPESETALYGEDGTTGAYRLEVGLYDLTNGERLQVSDSSENSISLPGVR